MISTFSKSPGEAVGNHFESFPALGVVLLGTAVLAPYEVPWLESLQERVRSLQILLSGVSDPRRPWRPHFGKLCITLQKTLTMNVVHKHPSGFAESERMLIPYDTISHLRRLRPDVIISAGFGASTVQALAYARTAGAKLIVVLGISERTEAGRGMSRTLLRRLLLRRADAIITFGESAVRYLKKFGVHEKKVFVIPRTTDLDAFLRLPETRYLRSARRLFFPGQFIPRKGLLPFLDVLARWANEHCDQQAELCLLGDGPERSLLEAHSRPPNLTVRFWKGVPYDELPPYYAQVGILAYPTLADEWGLIVNEALASGVPVLGSVHSQAVAEMVRDEVNGWTFNPEEPEEMYTAIHRALTAPPYQLSKMRMAARESVKRFTPQYAANQILQVLNLTCFSNRTD